MSGSASASRLSDWERWLSALGPFEAARKHATTKSYAIEALAVRTGESTPIAVMRHRGNPALLGQTIRRFIDWRRSEGLPPSHAPTFTIWHGDPRAPEHEAVTNLYLPLR